MNEKDNYISLKVYLQNILRDINIIKNENYILTNINEIESIIFELLNDLNLEKNLFELNYIKISDLFCMVYELNYDNNFSLLTDHISNELYAFMFDLEEELKTRY